MGVTVSLSELLRLAHHAARGKKRSPDVAAFLLDPVPKLAVLQAELEDGSYHPGAARAFVIEEPKRRLIAALPFRDRIVQHLLVAAQLQSLERWFAPQSYACRVGKGTHRALERARDLHRCFPWVLRLDIAKFFPSIDHEVLLRTLRSHTPAGYWWLVERIVRAGGPTEPVAFHFPGDDLFAPLLRPHGLPIGNLTSQIWANAVLTPVDHLLGSGLGLGAFVRYCDDVLVYAEDRRRLEDAWRRVRDLADRLRLRLHPDKCRLHRTTERVGFVGFVLERHGGRVAVHLRRSNILAFRRRMARLRGEWHPERFFVGVRAWLAHARHGHTRGLCRAELSRLVWTRPLGRLR